MYWMKGRDGGVSQDLDRSDLLGGREVGGAITDLLRLIKHGAEVPEAAASGELAKDLAEELLRIHVASLPAPVLLPAAGLTCVEARCAVHVVLFPLAFITEHLQRRTTSVAKIWCDSFREEIKEERKRENLVGFGQLSKLFLGLWVIFVGVRVVFLGHLCGCVDNKHIVNSNSAS